jgi:hypothetical protein
LTLFIPDEEERRDSDADPVIANITALSPPALAAGAHNASQ